MYHIPMVEGTVLQPQPKCFMTDTMQGKTNWSNINRKKTGAKHIQSHISYDSYLPNALNFLAGGCFAGAAAAGPHDDCGSSA